MRANSFLLGVGLGLSLAVPSAGFAADGKPTCDTGEAQQKLAKYSKVYQAVAATLFTDHCSSLKRVMRMIMGEVTDKGGRKLKPLTGLDLKNANEQYAKALADPTFTDALKAGTADVTDPVTRKVIEAALLEEQGYFDAEMLLVQELRAAAGVTQ